MSIMAKACSDKPAIIWTRDADEFGFLFSCCPVPAPEEVSVASFVPPVATVDGASHCAGSNGSGVLHCPLPDDSGQQPSTSHSL